MTLKQHQGAFMTTFSYLMDPSPKRQNSWEDIAKELKVQISSNPRQMQCISNSELIGAIPEEDSTCDTLQYATPKLQVSAE